NLQRRARQQPRLNVLGDFHVAFHHDPIRQLQQQDDEYQQPAPHVQVQFSDLDLPGAVGVRKSAGRNEQQNQRQQQQHAARRGQLFQDRPEQRFRDLPAPPEFRLFHLYIV